MRRGISTILFATIVMSVVVAVGFLLLFESFAMGQGLSRAASKFLSYEVGYSIQRLSLLPVTNGVVVVNCGASVAKLSYVVYRCSDREPYLVKIVNQSVEPGKSVSVYLGCKPVAVSVVTSSGRVFRRILNVTVVKNIVGTLQIRTFTLYGISNPQQLTKLFIVNNPELLAIPNASQVRLLQGVSTVFISGHYAPGKAKRPLVTSPNTWFYNVFLNTVTPELSPGPASFGIVLIGYDPSYLEDLAKGIKTSPRYFIMIIGAGKTPVLHVENATVDTYLPYASGTYSPGKWGRWRIKIWNFSGTITIYQNGVPVASTNPDISRRSVLGIWYYGYEIGAQLYLVGRASKVMYYFPAHGGGPPWSLQTTYDPYLAIADIDGDHIPDVVFIDEDVGYASLYGFDDNTTIDGRTVEYLDYTATPLILTLNLSKVTGLSNGGIPGSKYSLVYLYLTLFFHDDSWPDSLQFEDNDLTLPVFQVILNDSSGNSRVVYSIDYQTIANYHRTLIQNLSSGQKYFTKVSVVVPIPLPDPSKTYWISIEFLDLYNVTIDWPYIENDVDFTIGFETIGVVLIPRAS
ncbi:MAG: hypothetical protein GXO32_08945 [Crenarchaeota archaeon]|nr:hypothetical protein [Thermoproteota archaeon]